MTSKSIWSGSESEIAKNFYVLKYLFSVGGGVRGGFLGGLLASGRVRGRKEWTWLVSLLILERERQRERFRR